MRYFASLLAFLFLLSCGESRQGDGSGVQSPVVVQDTSDSSQGPSDTRHGESGTGQDAAADTANGGDSSRPDGDSDGATPSDDSDVVRSPRPDTSGQQGTSTDTSTSTPPAPPTRPATTTPPPATPPPTTTPTTSPPPAPTSGCEFTNGMFMPASGQLNALVLFIRYKDEDTRNGWWPADGFPSEWSTFIDETPEQRRTNHHNLTHFYREVSRNAAVPFTLVGVVDTVTANLSIANDLDYGQSNRAVLQQVEQRYNAQLANRLDQWSRAEHCHNRQSDGNIDLIIMIWRTNRFSSGTINWSGIAHIGGSRTPEYTFLGKNVKLPAFNSNFSSGVTVATRHQSVRDGLLNADIVFKSTVHEIAHQQITYWHPQGGADKQQRFPSMLAYAEQQIHSPNGRETAWLGWGNLIEVRRDTTITLGDYFETGQSVWVQTSRYRYLIENRQKTSIYDDASANPDDKGLFVHQFRSDRAVTLNYDGTNTNIIPIVSDGFYDWEFSGRWLPGWRAIFNRLGANAEGGSGFTRKQLAGGTNYHWISAMVIDGDEQPYDFRGTGLRAAYNTDRPRLGADTNPSISDMELEVLGQEGNAIRFRVRVR